MIFSSCAFGIVSFVLNRHCWKMNPCLGELCFGTSLIDCKRARVTWSKDVHGVFVYEDFSLLSKLICWECVFSCCQASLSAETRCGPRMGQQFEAMWCREGHRNFSTLSTTGISNVSLEISEAIFLLPGNPERRKLAVSPKENNKAAESRMSWGQHQLCDRANNGDLLFSAKNARGYLPIEKQV